MNSEKKNQMTLEQELEDLKAAYAALAARESDLSLLFNSVNINLGVVDVTDSDIRNVMVNKTAVSYQNAPLDHPVDGWASEYGASQERIDQWIKRYQQAEKEKRPIEFEYTLETKGEIRWLSATVQFMRRISNEVIRCNYAIEDITAQKQVEEARNESEKQFRELVELSPIAISIMDGTTGEAYLYVNPAWTRISGYSAIEATQIRPIDIVHPDMRPIILERAVARMKGLPVPSRYDLKVVAKNGQIKWLDFSVIVINYLGKPALFTVANDITEYRRSEIAFRESQRTLSTLMRNLPGMAYRCLNTQDWTMLFVSDGAVKLTGYRPDELINNQKVSYGKLVHVDDQEAVWVGVKTAVSENTPFELTYRIVTKDGAIKWVWEQGRSVETNAEGLAILEGFITDITERKLAEEELQKSKTLIKETQTQLIQHERLAAVGQLAAGIAHDFNNILAIIILYSQLAQQSNTISTVDYKRLSTIIDQGNRASLLVQQILDFSRQSSIERKPISLSSFMKNIKRLLARTLPETIQLEFHYDGYDCMVAADSTRLQQLLMNLALNARDAMPEGGQLQFRSHCLLDASNELCQDELSHHEKWMVITVADSGHGMTPEVQQHIFEPFFTTKEVGQGTGLGLAQAYGIVKQHDGIIKVNSTVNEGTQFTIYLPAITIKEQEVDSYKSDLSGGNAELILLVEDNAATRQALKEALLIYNYRVVEAENGREALQVLENKQCEVSLVLSDVIMPSLGGMELYEIVHNLYPEIKILLMSGYAQQESESAAFFEKMMWLKKPFTIEVLTQAVQRALNDS